MKENGMKVFPLLKRYHGPQAPEGEPFPLAYVPIEVYLQDPSLLEPSSFLGGVSTDGIIPAKKCLDPTASVMAGHAMTGLKNIKEGQISALQKGAVIVAGPDFGCGSSRVHAPIALHESVDYILVVGSSPDKQGEAERIFKENARAIGLMVFGVMGSPEAIQKALKQLNEGQLDELINSNYSTLDKLILQAGGITEFNIKRNNGEIRREQFELNNTSSRPQTAAEKIIASKATNYAPRSVKVVKPGDTVVLPVDITFGYELQTEIMIAELEKYFSEDEIRAQLSTGRLILFQDHTVSSQNPEYRRLRAVQREIAQRYGIPIQGGGEGVDTTEAICHTHYRDIDPQLPGTIIKGSDSHTPTSGVTGALAIGDGAISIGNDAYFGDTTLKVPESIRVSLKGELPSNCTMKDVMLKILSDSRIKNGEGIDCVLEYSGDGIRNTPMDDLSVLTNMAVEGGATTGIVVEPNVHVVEHLSKKHHVSESDIRSQFEAIKPDEDAKYAFSIELDLAQMTPMIAIDDNPRQAVAISSLIKPIPVTKAYIGSCTGGNFTDIENAVQMIARLPQGAKSAIPLVVQPSSLEILEAAQKMGYIGILEAFGAHVLLPGCGACLGMGPGGVEGPNETVFSTTNRNFPGRMGKGENSHVILGSVNSVIKACSEGLIQ